MNEKIILWSALSTVIINLIFTFINRIDVNNRIEINGKLDDFLDSLDRQIDEILKDKIIDMFYKNSETETLFQHELSLKINQLFQDVYNKCEIYEYIDSYYATKEEEEKYRKISEPIYKLMDIKSIEIVAGIVELHKRDILKKDNELYEQEMNDYLEEKLYEAFNIKNKS